MSGLSGIFNIGRRALFANQKALETTSQNIANVSTPGYSRQEAVFSQTRPENSQPGQTGTGVEIKEIRRLVDRFIESQIISGESTYGRLETEEGILRRIESVFSDAQGTGINQAYNDFFAALNDLATNPEDRAGRVVLLEQAETLVQRLNTTDRQLQNLRKDINSEVVAVISDINVLAGQIADLNDRIKSVEFTGQNANDLRDQRQLLLNELSGKININVIEDSLGATTVFVGTGKVLVEGNRSATLQGAVNADNSGYVNVVFNPGTGSTTNITSTISDGRLKGLIDLRDQVIPDYIDRIDQLVAATINEINQQHTVGFGLDGVGSRNFFSPLSPTSSALNANTGTGVIDSVTVSDATALTYDIYDLSFSGGNYTLTNRDTGTSTTGAYADPTTVTFEGLAVTISGGPATGDLFEISAHKGTAGTISVAQTDPDAIAASATAAGIPGDNGNARLLAAIQNNRFTELGGNTLQGFYAGFIGDVGALSQSTQRNFKVEETIRLQLGTLREEVSGVSLDEELTNIIRFQRAYEASARVIRMVDELYEIVLGLKR